MRQQIVLMLVIFPAIAFGQFGVGFHQSNLPFVAFSYQTKGKLRPELRIATDNYLESLSLEAVLTYNFIRKEDYECYAGLGVRSDPVAGLVVPVGLNVYPFEVKQLGFHIELAPIVNESVLLRGSWGIRYRFNRYRFNRKGT